MRSGLLFLGLQGMIDPPRAEAITAVPFVLGLTAAGALGSALSLVALALALLSLLLPLFVRMRDSFHALMIACFVWLAPLIPTAAFIYRPDVFDGHPRLRETIVLSTLLWNDATSAWLGPAALALVLPLCALMLTLAAHLLERTDVS